MEFILKLNKNDKIWHPRKQGIGQVYGMVDICKGLIELRGMCSSKRDKQNENVWPTLGFQPTILGFESRYKVNVVYVYTQKIKHSMFCRVLHFVNSYQTSSLANRQNETDGI